MKKVDDDGMVRAAAKKLAKVQREFDEAQEAQKKLVLARGTGKAGVFRSDQDKKEVQQGADAVFDLRQQVAETEIGLEQAKSEAAKKIIEQHRLEYATTIIPKLKLAVEALQAALHDEDLFFSKLSALGINENNIPGDWRRHGLICNVNTFEPKNLQNLLASCLTNLNKI